MPTAVIMPELGESIVEGTIVRWIKKEGDSVQEDEPIVEIMTDKVNTELPAPASGVISKLLVGEGDTVAVGQEIATIEASGSATATADSASAVSGPPPLPDVGFYKGAEEAPPTAVSSTNAAGASPVSTDGSGNAERRLSPLVRKMMADNQLTSADLANISGSGAAGRITKNDLERFIAARATEKQAAPAPAPASVSQPVSAPAAAAPAMKGGEEVIPLAGMRKVIADHLTHSYHTAVHVTTVLMVDVSKMMEFRERNKESFQQQYGVRLTYTPFFVKATAEALQAYPMMNSSIVDDKIVVKQYINMGIAVALGEKGEDGLIVPVIRDTHTKNLVDIARDLEDIAKRARNKSIGVADIQGATFTLTNPGSYGALIGTPIINHPQSAILGTYAIVKTPVVINDMIAIRPIMHLCLSYDHRLIDGMYAGKFMQKLKGIIENFEFFK
ncbi:MAG: 2-oxo acid dehydrogenase subunit E2 [Fimbriimonadia bacterium]|nr:2-oxo acid dehydrogenase subunit E2 [Fimbriimonadia bacterium]